MPEFINNSGFWFAIGIAVGLLIEIGGRFFFDWWYRPKLEVSLRGLWPVETGASIIGPASSAEELGQPVRVIAYRFKVSNKGRRSAENTRGTIEFENVERRICWYEGNVASLDINAHDHSFLDGYGPIKNADGTINNRIVMPTEHGWTRLYPKAVGEPLAVILRVTCKNGKAAKALAFKIDPAQQCKPVKLDR